MVGFPASAMTSLLEHLRSATGPAATAGPDEVLETFTAWASAKGLRLYPAQEEALLSVLAGDHVIVNTPTGSGKSLVALGAHLAALASAKRSWYTRAYQGPGVGEVLRAVRRARDGQRRHAHRRRLDQPRRAGDLLHGRGAGQRGPALWRGGSRRPGRNGRVPFLCRPRPGLGMAGTAHRDARVTVRPHVGHPGRRHPLRRRFRPAHGATDNRGHLRRAPGAARLPLRPDVGPRHPGRAHNRKGSAPYMPSTSLRRRPSSGPRRLPAPK